MSALDVHHRGLAEQRNALNQMRGRLAQHRGAARRTVNDT
jgi:hypothetical protein